MTESWKLIISRFKPWEYAALLLCILICILLIWERQPGAKSSEDGSPVTKPYQRVHDPNMEKRTKNPREDFEAARKRGMTEEEVRLVVKEYFQAIAFEDQPGRPVEMILNEAMEKRLDLYFDALEEGFNLTKEQVSEIRGKLPGLVAQQVNGRLLLVEVERAWESTGPDEDESRVHAKPSALTRLEKIEIFVKDPTLVFYDELYPWKISVLNESQQQMIGYQDEAGEWMWVDGSERTLDYGITDCYADLNYPFEEDVRVMDAAGEVFPLSMWQVERMGDFEDESVSPHTPRMISGSDLDRVKLLSRPQLKTLLLLNPEIAGRLKKDLEATDMK